MKNFAVLLSTIILQTGCFSQTRLDKQKGIVLDVINAIIQNDSTKFYQFVSKTGLSDSQVAYDFKFLNKRFQKLKTPISIDSIRHYIEPNSIWKWNFETRIYVISDRYDYIDLKFMFEGEESDTIFLFSKKIHTIKEEVLIQAPNPTN